MYDYLFLVFYPRIYSECCVARTQLVDVVVKRTSYIPKIEVTLLHEFVIVITI